MVWGSDGTPGETVSKHPDEQIQKLRANGQRIVRVWSQDIRYNRKRKQLESIGLPNTFIQDRFCRRWRRLNLFEWIYPDAITTDKDVKWSQDFLLALAWVMGKDRWMK